MHHTIKMYEGIGSKDQQFLVSAVDKLSGQLQSHGRNEVSLPTGDSVTSTAVLKLLVLLGSVALLFSNYPATRCMILL